MDVIKEAWADQEILKWEVHSISATMVANKENFRFQMKYFYQYFQILSILTIIKAWWWSLISFSDSANTFSGSTGHFQDARVILASPVCRWFLKSKWLEKIRGGGWRILPRYPKCAFEHGIAISFYQKQENGK